MLETAKRRQLAHVLMLITTSCWAGNIVAGKEALAGFTPLALAQVRMIASAAIFALLICIRPGKVRLPRGGAHWLSIVLSGMTGVTLNQLLFISGLARTSALHAGLVVGLGPVIVLLLSAARGFERITVWKMCGISASFLGMALLMVERAGQKGEANWVGDLIVLSGSTAFAFYTLLVKEISGIYDDLTLNASVFTVAAVLMLPFATQAMLQVSWQNIPMHAWLGMGYMAVCGSVVGYAIYGFALRHLEASRVAAFTYLQPVVAAGLAVWLVHESISVVEVIGGLLIISGMYLSRERTLPHRGAATSNPAKQSAQPAESPSSD